jgi:hypothetical protein
MINTVQLTLTGALTRGEFVIDLYFNFDPPLSFPLSVITLSGVLSTAVGLGTDTFQADGGGRYDIGFQFAPSGFAMFSGSQSALYLLRARA